MAYRGCSLAKNSFHGVGAGLARDNGVPATANVAGMARSFYEPTTVKHYLGSADI
jgi:hypothetical protein